jgi:hypothetical protein
LGGISLPTAAHPGVALLTWGAPPDGGKMLKKQIPLTATRPTSPM